MPDESAERDRELMTRHFLVVCMKRMPDDPGRRADVAYAVRLLADNGMLFERDVLQVPDC